MVYHCHVCETRYTEPEPFDGLASDLPSSLQIAMHSTVESGYLAHAPDESTTATCELDNGTRGLTSSIILTHPHL